MTAQFADTLALLKHLRAALEEIADLGDKTLICASYTPGDDPAQAYSIGAHRAFRQTGDIALTALHWRP